MTPPDPSNTSTRSRLPVRLRVVAWWSALAVMLLLSVMPGLSAPRTFSSPLVSASAPQMVYAPDQMFADDGASPAGPFLPPWNDVISTRVGDELVVRSSSRRLPLPDSGHVWELVEADEHLSRYRAVPEDPASMPEQELALVEAQTEFDALRALQRVDVLRQEGVPLRCEASFGRFRCGPADWNYVGATTLTIDGRQQPCIWMHPHDEGPLVLRFAIPAGYDGLNASFALADAAADESRDTVITVSVVDEQEAASSVEMAVRFERGWQDSVIRLDPAIDHQVRIEVQADDPGMAHLCGRVSAARAQQPETPAERHIDRRTRSEFEARVRGRLAWMGLSSVRWMRVLRNELRTVTVPAEPEVD